MSKHDVDDTKKKETNRFSLRRYEESNRFDRGVFPGVPFYVQYGDGSILSSRFHGFFLRHRIHVGFHGNMKRSRPDSETQTNPRRSRTNPERRQTKVDSKGCRRCVAYERRREELFVTSSELTMTSSRIDIERETMHIFGLVVLRSLRRS